MSLKDHLPSFKSPPLNEVVFGVQFDAIDAFKITTYGLLWEMFKKDFPNVEHHLPLNPQFEKIGGKGRSLYELPGLFNIPQLNSAPLPRVWFISENDQELIQIQPDRFIRNWRLRENGTEYPRYESYLREEFLRNLKTLEMFYRNNGLGNLNPNQCEISYINHIGVDKTHQHLSEIFKGWSNQYNISNIAELEALDLNIRHIVRNEDNKFIGRLYIKITPAFKVVDNSSIFVIEITLRGYPKEKSIDGIMEFMDFGRERIVRTFTEVTTPEMHKIWQRER